jgi:hypothetical protein
MPHRWDPVAPPLTRLVRPVPIDPVGLDGPTRGQSEGPRWRRVAPRLFVPATVSDELVEQRILEAAQRCGDRAVVTGWAALRIHGAGYFDGPARDGRTRLPVPVAANGERLGNRPGLQRTRDTVPFDEIVMVHGIRCAQVERALFDEIRRVVGFREQVVAADMTFAAQLTSVRRMRRYRMSRFWYRDVRRLDQVLLVADEHSRSGQRSGSG